MAVEIESVGIVQRFVQSIKSVVGGILIFLLAFPLIFWNEGRAVQTARSLTEGAGAVVSLASPTVDPSNESKLVHFTGEARGSGSLADPNFGVDADAIHLRRQVEMYQWRENESTETRDKVGGGQERVTTYTYDKVWSDDPIDSSRFNERNTHTNPSSFRYQPDEWTASPVTVGEFTLSPDLVSSMNSWEDLTIDNATSLPVGLQGVAKAHDGRYYFGGDPNNPAVGDLRVSFDVVWPGPVSVIAEQAGTSLRAYQTEAGDALSMLHEGNHSADSMFDQAQSANTSLTWILRGVAFVMMFAGLSALFRPIAVIAGVVPIFGRAVSLFAALIAAVAAFFFWLVAVGISWLAARPLLGIALLVVAALALAGTIALGVMLFRAAKNRKAAAPA